MTPHPKDDWAEEEAEKLLPCWQPTTKGCECPPHRYRPYVALALRQARNRGLEEAAKVAETIDPQSKTMVTVGHLTATHIRALREVL